MKHRFPTNSNKPLITMYLKETFLNRRQWILEQNPTIFEIFEKYARLLDYNGEMV